MTRVLGIIDSAESRSGEMIWTFAYSCIWGMTIAVPWSAWNYETQRTCQKKLTMFAKVLRFIIFDFSIVNSLVTFQESGSHPISCE